MNVQTAVSDSACHTPAFSLSDMLTILSTKFFCQPEIDKVNLIFRMLVLRISHKKICRLDVTMDNPTRMNELDLFQDLHENHQCRFECHRINF